MPSLAPHSCPHCRSVHVGRCPVAQAALRQRVADRRRGEPSLYGAEWRKATRAWRAESYERNLCVECRAQGRVVYGPVTDHRIPHRGDFTLFWDRGNWQAMCVAHHNAKTTREDGGFGNATRDA